MNFQIEVNELPVSVPGESDDPDNECAIAFEDGEILLHGTNHCTHYVIVRKRGGRPILKEVGFEKAYR